MLNEHSPIPPAPNLPASFGARFRLRELAYFSAVYLRLVGFQASRDAAIAKGAPDVFHTPRGASFLSYLLNAAVDIACRIDADAVFADQLRDTIDGPNNGETVEPVRAAWPPALLVTLDGHRKVILARPSDHGPVRVQLDAFAGLRLRRYLMA